MDPWQKWFEDIWADREDRIYPAFFGNTGPGIYTIPANMFAGMGEDNPDPRFLTHGVFECPPAEAGAAEGHADWIYISSGMSNPWGDKPGDARERRPSGLGFELTLHTRERARWAISLMQWVMAAQLLIASGAAKGDLIEYDDLIPLGRPLGSADGLITHLLIARPEQYAESFTLASGHVDWMQLVGITQREADFVRSQGVDALTSLLKHRDVLPITDPKRQSMI